MLETNIMWNTIHCKEICWLHFKCWQTEWVPCQQESAWSMACLLFDHSPGHLWLPHTRGTAGFSSPVVLQLWVSDLATIKREFLSHFYIQQIHNLTLGCLLWMCCLTFLVSRRLISLTSACLSAWFLAEKRNGRNKKNNNNRTAFRCSMKAGLEVHQR